MKTDTSAERLIRPVRYIPFDIGAALSETKLKRISELLERKYQRLSPDGYFRAIGSGVALVFRLTEQCRLYVFRYGIGVFSIEDAPYRFDTSDAAFATEYCQQRKYRHKQILNFQAEYSRLIQDTIRLTRLAAHVSRNESRVSASDAWECNGLSYVMTVSYLYLEKSAFAWEQLDDTVKKNLLVMLTPSLMNMEDSLCSTYDSASCGNIESLNLKNYEPPRNYSQTAEYGIYISWAAVIPILKKENTAITELIEVLEADLQAMWMYVYCMQQDFIRKKRMPYGMAENVQFNAQREFVRFHALSDTSMPEYIRQIRTALIETSGMQELMNSFVDDLQYMIRKNKVLRDIRLERMEYAKTATLISLLGISAAELIRKRHKGWFE